MNNWTKDVVEPGLYLFRNRQGQTGLVEIVLITNNRSDLLALMYRGQALVSPSTIVEDGNYLIKIDLPSMPQESITSG